MKIQKCFIVVLMVGFLSLTPLLSIEQTTKAQDENPLKIEKVIGLSTIPGTFRKPTGIAVAKDGTIFVADSGESQIEVFDTELKYLYSFGSIGSGDRQFQSIQQIRFDKNDNLYVLDGFLCQMQVFSKEGKLIRKWEQKGSGTKKLNFPSDFAFLNNKELLIIDSLSAFEFPTVFAKVFTTEGEYVKNFVITSSDNTPLIYDKCAVDATGNVYMTAFDFDSLEDVFLKYTQNGELIGNFISWGEKDENINDSFNCMYISGDSFYITDGNAIKKYKIEENPKKPLQYQQTIVQNSNDETSIVYPSALLIQNNKIYSIDYTYNRFTIYDDQGDVLGSFQSPIAESSIALEGKNLPNGIFSIPRGMTIGPDNNFYVISSNYNEIKIFTPDWEEIKSFGKEPNIDDESSFKDAFDIVFDNQGYCYITDRWTYTIHIYKPDLTPHMNIKFTDITPLGITINVSGFLVVCLQSYEQDEVCIYDISKVANKKITKKQTLSIPDLAYSIVDVVSDEHNNMIVSMLQDNLVLWISSDGEIIQTVDAGSYPRGLLQDGAGNIYITLPEKQSIQKLSSEGKVLWEVDIGWYSLAYMMMDSEGTLYVTDLMHSVILVLSDTTAIPPVPMEPKPIQTNATFSFTVSSDTITEEDPVTFKVIGNDIEKCTILEISIQYPAELVNYQSIKIGSAFKKTDFKITENSEIPGFLLLTFLSKKEGTFNDSGELVEIQFIANHFGSGKIEFSNIVMQDNMGVEILYKNKNNLPFTVLSNDKTPPVVKLQPIPQLVYDPFILIQGETEPDATVTINQKPVGVKPDGKFEMKVDLQKGKNKITITATDKAGNKTELILETTLQNKIIIKLYISNKVIMINDTPSTLDSEPYIDKRSGRTMVPLRAIGEAIGATISFDASAQRIDIQKESTIIQLWIGKPKAKVNGKEVDIDPDKPVSPVIVKGRTFLPLRFVAEQFEFKVEWDAPTQRITLTYPKD